jgi:hypothetical protein
MFYMRLKYRTVFSKVYAETISKAPSINMHKNYAHRGAFLPDLRMIVLCGKSCFVHYKATTKLLLLSQPIRCLY